MARHCSDEHLLALRDGELGVVSKFVVERHIQSCWLCRGRLSYLDAQVQRLAEAWDAPSPDGLRQVEAARERFLAWARNSGVEFPPRISRLHALGRLRWPGFAMAGTLVMAATMAVWHRASEPRKETPTTPVASASRQADPLSPPAAPSLAVPITRPAQTSAAPPAPAHPSAEELLDAEIEVRFVLHRAAACLGEPVEVSIAAGRVSVLGTVSSVDQKRTLTNALTQAHASAWINLDLRTPEELPPTELSLAAPGAVEVEAPTRDRALEKVLARHFRSAFPGESDETVRARVTGATNAALRKADAAAAEGWALRRLRDRFAGEHLSQLRPRTLLMLHTMAREHTAALRALVEELRNLLSPVLASWPQTPAAPEQGDVFLQVQRMQMVVDALCGGPALPGRTPEQLSTELQGLWRDLSEHQLVGQGPFEKDFARAAQ